jgi:hypothetical protein
LRRRRLGLIRQLPLLVLSASIKEKAKMRKSERRRNWQLSRIYGFVRSRQLEGTLTLSPKVGVFIITANRIQAGWGSVSEKRWQYPKKGSEWPPTEPSGLDAIAKYNRICAYFRVRNLDDLRRSVADSSLPLLAVPIHAGWYDAPKGLIALPTAGQVFHESHCVLVVGYDDGKQLLTFMNCWGGGWGDKGFGYLPYEYFNQFFQDSWFLFPKARPLPCPIKNDSIIKEGKSEFIEVDFVRQNCLGNICAIYDLWDVTGFARIGWCFATVREGYLDVEEFFVMPQFRRQRAGSILMSKLLNDSRSNDLPLRFWIPYCDVYSKSANIQPFNRLLTRGKFTSSVSGVRWSLFKAIQTNSAEVSEIAQELPHDFQAPPGGINMLDCSLCYHNKASL